MAKDGARRLAKAKSLLAMALRLLDELGEDDAAVRVQHAIEVAGRGWAPGAIFDRDRLENPPR